MLHHQLRRQISLRAAVGPQHQLRRPSGKVSCSAMSVMPTQTKEDLKWRKQKIEADIEEIHFEMGVLNRCRSAPSVLLANLHVRS